MSAFKQYANNLKQQRFQLKKLFWRYRLKTRHITEKTLETVFNVSIVSVPVICCVTYVAYHSFALKWIKQFVRLKADGEEPELSHSLDELAYDVWNSAKIPRRYKVYKLAEFFPVNGPETFSAGSLESRLGCIIGLPYNWNYNDVSDIRRSEIQFTGKDNQPIDWESDVAMRLLKSLVVSENAKRFAIAHQIHLANTFQRHVECVLLIVSTWVGIALGKLIIDGLRLPRRIILRLVVRLVAFASVLWAAKLMSDMSSHNYNIDADNLAVKEAPEYLEGGIEYFEKLLERNASLHVLLGDIGKQKYTEDGELKGMFVIPIRDRLEKLKKLLEEQKSQEEGIKGKV